MTEPTKQYLPMYDPPGGTRMELIAARLRGDWDAVDRILGEKEDGTPCPSE